MKKIKIFSIALLAVLAMASAFAGGLFVASKISRPAEKRTERNREDRLKTLQAAMEEQSISQRKQEDAEKHKEAEPEGAEQKVDEKSPGGKKKKGMMGAMDILQEGEKGKGQAKSGKKELTTDEMLAMVDYNIPESAEAGKLLWRKKMNETATETKRQMDAEKEESRKHQDLEKSLRDWLERTE